MNHDGILITVVKTYVKPLTNDETGQVEDDYVILEGKLFLLDCTDMQRLTDFDFESTAKNWIQGVWSILILNLMVLLKSLGAYQLESIRIIRSHGSGTDPGG